MRRSSSKKRSERAATAANTITELDDSVLESQVMAADLDDVDSQLGSDEDGALAQSTSKICETASFRFLTSFFLRHSHCVPTEWWR